MGNKRVLHGSNSSLKSSLFQGLAGAEVFGLDDLEIDRSGDGFEVVVMGGDAGGGSDGLRSGGTSASN